MTMCVGCVSKGGNVTGGRPKKIKLHVHVNCRPPEIPIRNLVQHIELPLLYDLPKSHLN